LAFAEFVKDRLAVGATFAIGNNELDDEDGKDALDFAVIDVAGGNCLVKAVIDDGKSAGMVCCVGILIDGADVGIKDGVGVRECVCDGLAIAAVAVGAI